MENAPPSLNGESTSEATFTRMVELRRAFHRRPELAFHEEHTARLVMEELDRLGITYTYDGVGSAVVGRLDGARAGPTVALRAEMDALPGTEATGLPFASEIEGRVHACGHDAHMAMVLGAAARLSRAPPPAGNLRFVFQPAEERGAGSKVVLASGALDDVDAIFAGHVTHRYRVGEIMVAPGIITAQSDRCRISVHGQSGHGARPHEATDAVVITGLLIATIQTIVSRQINPVHPSVITIGKVRAGTAPNVIAEHALLDGTLRTTRPEVRSELIKALQRTARALGDLYDARIEVEITEGYPPVVNALRETAIARRAACQVVGESGLVTMEHPSMGSEDFSFMLQRINGCYVRFGARLNDDEYIPLHSMGFDVDERVLAVGAAWFDAVSREALHELSASGGARA